MWHSKLRACGILKLILINNFDILKTWDIVIKPDFE